MTKNIEAHEVPQVSPITPQRSAAYLSLSLGKKAEEDFLISANKIGVVVCDREAVDKGNPGYEFAIARATQEEDEKENTDFWYFIGGKTNKWFRIDLTTNPDTGELAKKKEKGRTGDVEILRIESKTLELASRGSYKDLETVVTIFGQLTSDLISRESLN